MRIYLCLVAVLALSSVAVAQSFGEGASLALQAPRVRTTPGAEYGPQTRIFQGIPGIERAGNGRLWAAWYGGGKGEGPDNYVMLTTSGDDGRTWSDLKLVIDPAGPIRAFDPCLWRDPRGKLWLFWAQAHTWWDGRGGVWAITTDHPDREDASWSPPRRICDGVMLNKPLVLRNGDWLLPVARWSVAPKVDDPAARFDPGAHSGANVVASTDGGATWAPRGGVRVPDRSFDEHMLIERKNGALWLLARNQRGMAESSSADQGRTWSNGAASPIPHLNTRFFLRRLRTGRLLLVRHDPPAGDLRRSHLAAFLSDDDGLTWKGRLSVDDRLNVSYPDGVEDPDGSIYLIYDRGRTGAKEILMAVFTEADVLAGHPVSAAFRARVLVSRATGSIPVKPGGAQ